MTINAAGLALLREYEGCRLAAYLDAGGTPTIGNGHTLNVHLGQRCSQDQAEVWLAQDAAAAESVVRSAVRVPLNPNERAACSVLAFNIGAANFRASSVCRLLNAGDRAGAARSFLLWDKARVNGRLVGLPGLARRRAAEAHLFLTPVAADVPKPGKEDAQDGHAGSAPPEESGISGVERPPAPISGKVTAGTAIAGVTGAAAQVIEKVEPVHDGLALLGFSPQWIAAALGVLLLAALVYVGWHHLRARRAALA